MREVRKREGAQNGSLVCQHGAKECAINKFESCLLEYTRDGDYSLDALVCIEKELKAGNVFEKAVGRCFRSLQVSDDIQRLIQFVFSLTFTFRSCYVTKEGERLQEAAEKRTTEVSPEQHHFVPWVLFNNVSIGSAQILADNLTPSLCGWFVFLSRWSVQVQGRSDSSTLQARLRRQTMSLIKLPCRQMYLPSWFR